MSLASPGCMKLKTIRTENVRDRLRVTGEVEGFHTQPYFEFPRVIENYVAGTADAFLPALLIPAIERGEPLEIVPPISPRLVSRLPQILDVVHALFPSFPHTK